MESKARILIEEICKIEYDHNEYTLEYEACFTFNGEKCWLSDFYKQEIEMCGETWDASCGDSFFGGVAIKLIDDETLKVAHIVW